MQITTQYQGLISKHAEQMTYLSDELVSKSGGYVDATNERVSNTSEHVQGLVAKATQGHNEIAEKISHESASIVKVLEAQNSEVCDAYEMCPT